MKQKHLNTLLIGVIIIGILAGAHLAFWNRHQLEKDFNRVELVMDYQDIKKISALAGVSEREAMERLKDDGLTTVLFKEATIEDLQSSGEVAVFTGGELLQITAISNGAAPWLQGLIDEGAIVKEHSYLLFSEGTAFERVCSQLQAKTDNVIVHQEVAGVYLIETPMDSDALGLAGLKLGLGFPEDALKVVEQAGLYTMVQIRNWPGVTVQGIETIFEPLRNLSNLSAVLFNDEIVPGQPQLLGVVAEQLRKTPNETVATIEFFPQQGLGNLALLLDKKVVRLHSIAPNEINKYNPREAIERYVLAASERNHRALLVRPFPSTGNQDALSFYEAFLANLTGELQSKGLQVGKADKLPASPVSTLVIFITGWGVIAGGLLLLNRLGVRRGTLLLGAAGLVLWAGLLYIQPMAARKLMALISVIVFPTLGVLAFVPREAMGIPKAVLRLVKMSAVSLIGALLMVGLLADVGFMLKLNQFAGVKIAHVVPLLVVGAYFAYRSTKGEKAGDRIYGVWQKPLTVGIAVVGGLLLLAIAYYVSRTGNEAVAVSQLELQFRSFLDNLLGVRPRTKEFLLGHPAMLALLYFGYRDNRFLPLLVVGTIGQISLVNTFAHIHTPLIISLIRAGHGLWLGILIGVLLIAAYKVLEKRLGRYLHG
ncbi:DUF5693 family protein [Desulfofalx alkaliphila]|uniref:DUF5693 family protein n=1 Tax=Desulfofalx alkaliphila TaxID=105483 RepID=UPI0004E0E3E4|nr:DUF5693 family protein [Desulfofalx alkaliphila]